MLINLPPVLQHFFQIIFINFSLMGEEQRNYVKATVCAILFHQEKVSMRIIGSILPGFKRTKSAVSKMYSNSKYFCREVAWQSTMVVCKRVEKRMPIEKRGTPWVLIFDTTHRTRFGKLLQNLIGTHGENSKKRFFPCVWSILIAPTGERISLPCPIWYSKQYAKDNNFVYKTQPQLAVLTSKWLEARFSKLKFNFDLVILADSAFECSPLWKLCENHNAKGGTTWTLITNCSEDRCVGSNGPKASRITGVKVNRQFVHSCICATTKLNIIGHTGIAVRSQRILSDDKISHFYRYANKRLRVSGIGDSNVVISYKLKYPDQALHLAPVKTFLCNNFAFSAEQIISYYSLRWEVETFFREQKSDLAFNHFQAWNPVSCYRFIDHLTITFNFLEFYRLDLLDSPDYTLVDSQESLTYMRTRLLKETFRRQAFADQIQWILERTETSHGRRRLRETFFSLEMPFNFFNFFTNFQRTRVLRPI